MDTHSIILTWRIPWTEEPGGLQSMGSQRVGHDWVTNGFTFRFRDLKGTLGRKKPVKDSEPAHVHFRCGLGGQWANKNLRGWWCLWVQKLKHRRVPSKSKVRVWACALPELRAFTVAAQQELVFSHRAKTALHFTFSSILNGTFYYNYAVLSWPLYVGCRCRSEQATRYSVLKSLYSF